MVEVGSSHPKGGTVTEGGEALVSCSNSGEPSWHVLWTRSHCERAVHEQLEARGFLPFLPTIEIWSRRRGRKRLIVVPMFPGYLFLHAALDKKSHVEVRKAVGLVRILGDAWDRPAVVPDHDVAAIRQLMEAGLQGLPHPYLREGQRARVTDGPLAGVEGILVKSKLQKGLLVLSVDLLQRSVAVEVDCTQVVPA